MRPLEALAREGRGAEAVLVGDHHELESGVAKPEQGGDDARDQPELLEGIDLLVLRFLDEHAVAIDEENAGGTCHHLVSAPSIAAFSSGVPTEIRRASPSWGMALMSRTTTPAPSRRFRTASLSWNRTSRKLP